MQLSNFTDFALRTLIYLAILPPDELTQIRKVSERYGVSYHHIVKVVHQLGLLGYVETIQGKNGGIRLKQAAVQINIANVIRALEPLQLVNCRSDFCHISPVCRLKHYLVDAKEAFLHELSQYTLDDLVKEHPDLHKKLL